MVNILSVTPLMIDLLKVEAARLMGVNSDNINVEYKQEILSETKKSIDYKDKNVLGFFLGIADFANDSPFDFSGIGVLFSCPNTSLEIPYIYFTESNFSYVNCNLFFNYLGFEVIPDSSTERVVSFLKFVAK